MLNFRTKEDREENERKRKEEQSALAKAGRSLSNPNVSYTSNNSNTSSYDSTTIFAHLDTLFTLSRPVNTKQARSQTVVGESPLLPTQELLHLHVSIILLVICYFNSLLY
jgi:hypothetical protein